MMIFSIFSALECFLCDSFVVLVCKGKKLLSMHMLSEMYRHIAIHEEGILEHTNVMCHLCTSCQLVNHCAT